MEQVLLFGSHAREGADEDSDIDLRIVSPDFVTLDRLDRQRVLSRARLCVEAPVHAYPATPSEVTAVEPATFLQEVLETGPPVAFAPAGRTHL